MPKVIASIVIKANKYDVYKLAKDMTNFPKFMKDVKEVKVIKRVKNKTITSWKSYIDEDTLIYWQEEDVFDDKLPTIKYKLLEGDLDKFEGKWQFIQKGNRTKVILEVNYELGLPQFEKLVGTTLKKKVKDNCMMMLTGIKERIERGYLAADSL